jgi:hypothetical protein
MRGPFGAWINVTGIDEVRAAASSGGTMRARKQAWSRSLGAVLVGGLLNDRFPAGTQAFCPRSPPQRQERRDLATVRWCSPQQPPHPARADTETCRGRGSGCPRCLAGQRGEQIAPPRCLGPVGVAVAQFIDHRACRSDGRRDLGQAELQRIGRHLFPGVGAEQDRLDAQSALHAPRQRLPAYSTRVPAANYDDIPSHH